MISCRRRPGWKPGRRSRSPRDQRTASTMAVVAEDSTIATDGRKTPMDRSRSGSGPSRRRRAFYAVFFVVPMLVASGPELLARRRASSSFPTFTLANYDKIATSALYHTLILRTVIVGLEHGAASSCRSPSSLSYLMRFVFERRGAAHPAAGAALAVQRLPRADLCVAHHPREAGPAQLGAPVARAHRRSRSTFLIYSNFAVVVTLVGLLLPLAVLPDLFLDGQRLARPSRGRARPRRAPACIWSAPCSCR